MTERCADFICSLALETSSEGYSRICKALGIKIGTVIVDEETHNPIALLDGRDGSSLRKWLKSNKHIKVITNRSILVTCNRSFGKKEFKSSVFIKNLRKFITAIIL